IYAQQYQDQQIVMRGDDLINNIESSENVTINTDNIELASGATEGSVTFKPQTSDESFNRGLPSWNGFAEENLIASFKVQMRFKTSAGWQRWVTVGFWDKEIWEYYGYTTFTGGKVYVDYVKVSSYIKEFQFKVLFLRKSTDIPAPSIKQLSFVVSDTRTTANLNITDIVNDNPPEIFVDTDFIYQYDVPTIGKDICSPSTSAMILSSYEIDVDIYKYALKTKDPEWGLYGVWPRNVQHAHMHGLRGTVNRYRTWSEAYEVLKNGGRIAMSLGRPLYTGHLVMLAGFDENGNVLVHNPARKNGYAQKYPERDIAESWFNKGGIAYTFYLEDNNLANENFDGNFKDVEVYPNPASDYFTIVTNEKIEFSLINNLGQVIISKPLSGKSKVDISNLNSGIYFIQLIDKNGNNNTRKFIIK
ncbi:MAG: T9SS type A sorting domain-containing protein, partial [Flavobacteriales bacterium]|nr:T9SS type A sorting domain-containing protein [Flavobacteriales bacterium]